MSLDESDPAPCGACGLDVTDIGIMCETCSQWYHPVCQDMGRKNSYVFHTENPDFSWVCLTCGARNHSVSVLDNNLASFASSNSFNTLSDSTSRSSVSSAGQRTNSHRLGKATLKVLNLNARSIKPQDKLDQFHAMLDLYSPDVVTCTESWLTSDIYNAEVIPDSLGYTIFRRDRGSRGGGVFILVKNLYIASRVQEWETDCEILWVKLQLAGSVPLHIAAYYKPNESDALNNSENLLKWFAPLKAMFGFWGILITPNSHGMTIHPSFHLTANTPASMWTLLTY